MGGAFIIGRNFAFQTGSGLYLEVFIIEGIFLSEIWGTF